jgi:hypothetical protein
MSPHNEQITFMVYQNEVLMRLITSFFRLMRIPLTPLTLGVSFLVGISLTLYIWAVFTETPKACDTNFVPFLKNISWSVSIVYIFPFVMGLTLKYYQQIPMLFDHLFGKVLERNQNNNATPEESINQFKDRIKTSFNGYLPPTIFFIITLILNITYFYQILSNPKEVDWMTCGRIFRSIFGSVHGLSPVGLYAAIIQIVLIYWTLNLLWKGFILTLVLYDFFAEFEVKIEPLHSDGCCGLREIGSVAMILNTILFLLGIYISLKVIDKTLMQHISLFADIGNPMMLGGYVIIAPLLFFFPLGSAHNTMKKEKDDFIFPISKKCDELFRKIGDLKIGFDEKGVELVQLFNDMEKIRNDMKRSIPVWPFDFKSLEAFFGTIVVPLLPVLLPAIVDKLFGLVQK